jgi:hypothetical protein
MSEENELTQDNGLDRGSDEAARHAQWVREHPSIETSSSFPDYPDDPARRGSSRGATPNGNPWRPVDPDEKPGRPAWDADTEPVLTKPSGDTLRRDGAPRDLSAAQPPLGESLHQPAIVSAENEADERIGRDIGDVLAMSKALDGKHVLVEVEDGEVYLRGTVADDNVRREVERLSSSVRAAKCIHNELDVVN